MSIKSDRGGAVRGRREPGDDEGGLAGRRLDGRRGVDGGLREDRRSHRPCSSSNRPTRLTRGSSTTGLRSSTRRRSRPTRITTSSTSISGNSYDNLYKPSEKGKPENDALLQKAVENYTLAVERLDANDPTEAKIKSLALQYLMAAYGPDKLDDPVKAEPVMIRLIELEPTEPAYYFQLAKLYEDAGEYEAAEKVYVAGKDAKPTDPAGYMQLAGYYDRQGEFDKEIAAFEQRSQQEPNNPEGFYTIATQYWDQAYPRRRA